MTGTESEVAADVAEVADDATDDVRALQRLPEDAPASEAYDPTCATTTVVGDDPPRQRPRQVDGYEPGSEPAREAAPGSGGGESAAEPAGPDPDADQTDEPH
jgi:hypothetical protein